MNGLQGFLNLHFHFGSPFELIGKGHFLFPGQPSLLLHLSQRTEARLSQHSVRHLWQSFLKAQPLLQWALPEFSPSEKDVFVATSAVACRLCAG